VGDLETKAHQRGHCGSGSIQLGKLAPGEQSRGDIGKHRAACSLQVMTSVAISKTKPPGRARPGCEAFGRRMSGASVSRTLPGVLIQGYCLPAQNPRLSFINYSANTSDDAGKKRRKRHGPCEGEIVAGTWTSKNVTVQQGRISNYEPDSGRQNKTVDDGALAGEKTAVSHGAGGTGRSMVAGADRDFARRCCHPVDRVPPSTFRKNPSLRRATPADRRGPPTGRGGTQPRTSRRTADRPIV